MKLKKNYNIFIPRNIKFLRNLKKDVERSSKNMGI